MRRLHPLARAVVDALNALASRAGAVAAPIGEAQ
jgi:hypothetical protein